MSPANWISIIVLVAAAVGAVITTLTRTIERLLDAKWVGNDQRVSKIEDRQDQADAKVDKIDTRLTKVETICGYRATIHAQEAALRAKGGA